MKNLQKLLSKICLPRRICQHLFGDKHTFTHRFIVGLVIAVIGIILAKFLEKSSSEIVSGIGDLSGYTFHAIGITPIIEELSKETIETEI